MLIRGDIRGTQRKLTRAPVIPAASRRARRGIGARLIAALAALAPLGYEDETGFHYGTQPHPYPVLFWEI